jgi:hypothetical protein
MESNEYELIVSQPKNPIWKIIISGIFFAFAIRSIVNIFLMEHFSDLTQEESVLFNKNIFIVMVCLMGGVYSSVRLTILIDTDKEKLVSRYFLGFFSINKISEIPELQYVAVSKNHEATYLINLRYGQNKSFNMCYTEEKELAINFAEMVASKLSIDMLDATEKGNPKWTYQIKS